MKRNLKSRRRGRRESTSRADELANSSFPFVALVNFICVIFLVIHRVVLSNKVYDDANGYANMALFLVLCMGAISIFPIKQAEFRLIRSRIQKEQVKNSGQVLKVSMLLAGGINLILSLLVFFLATKLSMLFFGNVYGAMSFQYIAFFLLVSSVSAVLMGYYDGNYKKEHMIITRVIYTLFLFLFVMIFSDKMLAYGVKCSNFLKTEAIKDSNGAAGICFGILLAAFIDVVSLFAGFLFMRNSLRADIRNDRTKTKESPLSIATLILKMGLQDLLRYVLFIGPLFLSVLFYCMNQKTQDGTKILSDLGCFFGKFGTIFMIPVIFSILASEKMIEYVWNAYQNKDYNKVRTMFAGEMNLQSGFMAFFVGAFLCLASPICEVFFHYGDIKITTNLLLLGSIVLLAYMLGFTSYRLLLGIRRNKQAIFSLGIAALVNVIVAIICEFALKLGLSGILISAGVFGIVLLFFSLRFLTRFSKYHQEWIRQIMIPVVAAIVLALIARLIYLIFKNPLGRDFSGILVLVLYVLSYGFLFLKIFSMKRKELQLLPGGTLLNTLIEVLRM